MENKDYNEPEHEQEQEQGSSSGPSPDTINKFVKDGKDKGNNSSAPSGKGQGSSFDRPKEKKLNAKPGSEKVNSGNGAKAGSTKAGATAGASQGAKAGAEAGKQGAKAGAEAGKSAAKTGAKVGAEVGKNAAKTGAKSNPYSAIAEAAIEKTNEAFKRGKDMVAGMKNTINGDTSTPKTAGGMIGTIIILICFLLLCAIVMIPSIIYSGFLNPENESTLTESTITDEERAAFFQQLLDEDIIDQDQYNHISSIQSLDEANAEVFKAIVDKGIRNTYENYISEYNRNPEVLVSYIAEQIGSILPQVDSLLPEQLTKFSPEAAELNLRNKPYYYSLKKNDLTPYTIGEYLDETIPEEDLNNDINYAELFTIFSQSEENQFNRISYERFYDTFASTKSEGLYYEMEIFEDKTWFYWNNPQHTSFTIASSENSARTSAAQLVTYYNSLEGTSEDTSAESSSEDTSEGTSEGIIDPLSEWYGYFYDCNVYPYGLNDIYEAVGISPEDPSLINPEMENKDVLDTQEGFLRLYLEETVDLGPGYDKSRNSTSLWLTLYNERNEEPTGRSCAFWTENHVALLSPPTPGMGTSYGTGLQLDYQPDGSSVIMDMPNYINQGNYGSTPRGDGRLTIGSAGCIDCSFAMAALYYNRTCLPMEQVSTRYVHGQSFHYGDFCADNGLGFRNGDFSMASIIQHLSSGNLIIVQIRGGWISETGRTLHGGNSTHYFVVMGYDDTGLYIYDPGNAGNTNGRPISYEDMSNCPAIQTIYMSSTRGASPSYEVNTIR